MSSIKTIAQTALTYDNHHIWSCQILKLLKANGFDSFLDPSAPPPPKLIQSTNGTLIPNPAYSTWNLIDQNLSALILSTISTPILPYVLNLNTTAEIWLSLTRRLQATHRSRVLQLKTELHNLSMKTKPMVQYLSEVKTIADHLASAGAPVENEDIILYVLNGLPASYQPFKAAIRTRPGSLPLEEFYSLLCSEEVNVSNELASNLNSLALYSNRGRGSRPPYRGRGRSTYRGGRSSDSYRNTRPAITCQICNKLGHSARSCWHRQNMEYQPQPPPSEPTALLHQTPSAPASNPASTDEWFLDTGASANLTPHL